MSLEETDADRATKESAHSTEAEKIKPTTIAQPTDAAAYITPSNRNKMGSMPANISTTKDASDDSVPPNPFTILTSTTWSFSPKLPDKAQAKMLHVNVPSGKVGFHRFNLVNRHRASTPSGENNKLMAIC